MAREEEERADDDDQRPHDPEVEAAHASSAVLARNSVAARARSRPRRSWEGWRGKRSAWKTQRRVERPPGRAGTGRQPSHSLATSLGCWQHRMQRTSPNSSRGQAAACTGHERSKRHSGDFFLGQAEATALARACACDSWLVHPAVQLGSARLGQLHNSAAGQACLCCRCGRVTHGTDEHLEKGAATRDQQADSG